MSRFTKHIKSLQGSNPTEDWTISGACMLPGNL
jgi:hypothetical protein